MNRTSANVTRFKNIHRGERCFIIATGPSLNNTNLSLIKDEILFGVNQLFEGYEKLGLTRGTQYHAVADGRILTEFKTGLEKLNSELFLVQSAAGYYREHKNQFRFVKEPTVIYNRLDDVGFSTDVSLGTKWGSTVTFDACMQIAYYMGFAEVYLLGLDCDYLGDAEHFDGKAWSWRERNTVPLFRKQFTCFKMCRKAFEADGRKIYNSTVGGKCEVFERVSLEDVINATPNTQQSYLDAIDKRVKAYKNEWSDYLPFLYNEAKDQNPKLIVEIGIGDRPIAWNTIFVFERVAKSCGAKLISVDIKSAARGATTWKDWEFVNQNDIDFVKHFPEFCKSRGIEPKIDVLLIDSSHLYDHTLAELCAWFPFLSDNAKVFLHDTNIKSTYVRKDGSTGYIRESHIAKINDGVIQAVQTYFGTELDKDNEFTVFIDGWKIRQLPLSCGLMVLDKNVCSDT